MPEYIDPGGGGSTGSPGVVRNGADPESQWLPGPIELPDYADMVIGQLVLPFGPKRIELQHAPQVVKQLTLNAVFRYDFGYLPNKYVIEGWPNGGDPQVMQRIIAQFGGDPLASIPLLVPIMGISDFVCLLSWNPYMDASMSWKEPFYHLEVESSQGGYTDLISGVAPSS